MSLQLLPGSISLNTFLNSVALMRWALHLMSSPFQDVVLFRADDRVVLDGALPGHLPPALLAHDVGLQARGAHHRGRVGRLAGRRAALRGLHAAQLHRPAARIRKLPRGVRILRAPRRQHLPEGEHALHIKNMHPVNSHKNVQMPSSKSLVNVVTETLYVTKEAS